jgi:hypothetical protein
VCSPKDQGGLGRLVFITLRSRILPYWESGCLSYLLWQSILKRKYIGPKALSQVLWKPGDSHFWAGLMAINKFFFGLGSFSIKDGSENNIVER